jgi:hypothetical protein
MAGTGGFRKGAGRKSNASRLVEAGFVASWFTSDFQEIKWKSFLESDDERIALDATKYLTEAIRESASIRRAGTFGCGESRIGRADKEGSRASSAITLTSVRESRLLTAF